jgi:hypothetical protein
MSNNSKNQSKIIVFSNHKKNQKELQIFLKNIGVKHEDEYLLYKLSPNHEILYNKDIYSRNNKNLANKFKENDAFIFQIRDDQRANILFSEKFLQKNPPFSFLFDIYEKEFLIPCIAKKDASKINKFINLQNVIKNSDNDKSEFLEKLLNQKYNRYIEEKDDKALISILKESSSLKDIIIEFAKEERIDKEKSNKEQVGENDMPWLKLKDFLENAFGQKLDENENNLNSKLKINNTEQISEILNQMNIE